MPFLLVLHLQTCQRYSCTFPIVRGLDSVRQALEANKQTDFFEVWLGPESRESFGENWHRPLSSLGIL